MPANLIQYAYVSGEISPTLLGRTDLEKYDLGLAEARNWFVDYRGGLSSRPGSIFCDVISADEMEVVLHPFQFAPDDINNYVVLLGHHYARFIQDGGYVLEGEHGASIAADGTITTNGPHGYAPGDFVKLFGHASYAGTTFIVTSVPAPNSLRVRHFADSQWYSGPDAWTGGIARVYTIATPWPEWQLRQLKVAQVHDTLRCTHAHHPVYNLARYDHADWRISAENFDPREDRPSGLTAVSKGNEGGPNSYLWAVTAVFSGNVEGLPIYAIATSIRADSSESKNDFTTTFTWNPVPGAIGYRFYRSNLVFGKPATMGQSVGFLGRVIGTELTETNGVPDFTRTPPTGRNPFAAGAVEEINVTNGGTGYLPSSVVWLESATGYGFLGAPVVSNGRIVGVRIINPGAGYQDPVTLRANDGTGLTAEVKLAPMSGNFPSVSGRFQQRQIYAASIQQPMTLWGSVPGKYNNFNETEYLTGADPFEFELDSEQIAPIRHMVSTRSGLLLMTAVGIWQLSGGNDVAVTPTNALASPHTYTGVADVKPIRIDTDIVYVDAKTSSVKMLTYSDYARTYSSEDVSILSNHFFSLENPIVQWTFAEAPYKMVWAVRADGAMLAFTFVKEQKVFAWTQHWTLGKYRDVCGIQEGPRDSVYTIVSRQLQTPKYSDQLQWWKFLEMQAPRDVRVAEEAWSVDSGLALGTNPVNVALDAWFYQTDPKFVWALGPVFNAGHVGWIIRARGGKYRITEVLDEYRANVIELEESWDRLSDDPLDRRLRCPPGEWTLDRPVREVSGLWHLEGEQVSILADGNVMPPRTVVDGKVTLDAAATRVTVGLGFRCVAKSLPSTVSDAVIEHRGKSVIDVHTRVHQSRGLLIGETLDNLYTAPQRRRELYGEPMELFNGYQSVKISGGYAPDDFVYYVLEDPLPATILNSVKTLDAGDDTE